MVDINKLSNHHIIRGLRDALRDAKDKSINIAYQHEEDVPYTYHHPISKAHIRSLLSLINKCKNNKANEEEGNAE